MLLHYLVTEKNDKFCYVMYLLFLIVSFWLSHFLIFNVFTNYSDREFRLSYRSFSIKDIKMSYTKVWNHSQPPTTTQKTTHNHPQPPTTTHNYPQPPTTTHNHPQLPKKPTTTIHNHPQPPKNYSKKPLCVYTLEVITLTIVWLGWLFVFMSIKSNSFDVKSDNFCLLKIWIY